MLWHPIDLLTMIWQINRITYLQSITYLQKTLSACLTLFFCFFLFLPLFAHDSAGSFAAATAEECCLLLPTTVLTQNFSCFYWWHATCLFQFKSLACFSCCVGGLSINFIYEQEFLRSIFPHLGSQFNTLKKIWCWGLGNTLLKLTFDDFWLKMSS